MKGIYLSTCLILVSFLSLHAQQYEELKWYTIEEAMKLKEEVNKPVLIDFYTDWCGWCKKMDATTFSNPNIVQYLNQNFYPVKFDAETRDTIEFDEKTYVNQSTGRRPPHDLAIELLGSRMSYPTMVYIDKNDKRSVVPGYMAPEQIQPLLVWFAEENNLALNFDEFKSWFDLSFTPENDSLLNADYTGSVEWLNLEEALEKHSKNQKKIFLYFEAEWFVGNNMMQKSTFTHPTIANYLNQNYYPVKFNVLSRDTVNAFDHEFVNPAAHPSFHSLPIAMLEGEMKFPAMVYLDENLKLINKVQFYCSPEMLEPMLQYFGKGKYLDQSWLDFKNNFQSSL